MHFDPFASPPFPAQPAAPLAEPPTDAQVAAVRPRRRVAFSGWVTTREFVVGADDVRSLAGIMSVEEHGAMMANRFRSENGEPLME